MGNRYDNWKNSKLPAGQAWAQRGLAWAAAGTVTAAVWLSVVLMAGLDLPASAPGYLEAAAPLSAPLGTSPLAASPRSASVAAAPVPQIGEPAAETRSVRHAAMLPRVTITGKREPAPQQPTVSAFEIGVAPTAPASVGPTVGITVAGDNLNQ